MRRKLLLAIFFLSGISALIYEVCWIRQTTLTLSVSLYAYSLVAGAAWWLMRNEAEAEIESLAAPSRSAPKRSLVRSKHPTPAALRFMLWAYALSGFAALGYEVVWARLISLHTVGAIYSFSISF
jgi:spermidine synthase